MPCVISRWSPDLVFVVFVTTESNLGQCPFTLDDAFFPTSHGGKRFLDCVWVRLLSMGLRDHMQERSYLTRSFCCPWGERKTLRVWVRLLFMGPRVYIPERTISCQLWMGGSLNRSMWYDGRFVIKLPYVDFIALEIILLVLTDYNIQFNGIILRNFVFHHLIILVTLLLKMILQYSVSNFPN